jgi:hypothetical protein
MTKEIRYAPVRAAGFAFSPARAVGFVEGFVFAVALVREVGFLADVCEVFFVAGLAGDFATTTGGMSANFPTEGKDPLLVAVSFAAVVPYFFASVAKVSSSCTK